MTNSSYEIKVETFQDCHIEPYALLSRIEYGNDAAISQPAHLRWKFLENPFGASTGIHLYKDGELVGRITAMPKWFRYGGRTYTCAHIVDLLVHPRHRKIAALLHLTEGLKRMPGFDFLMLTPNRQAFAFWKTIVKLPELFDLDVAVVPLRPAKLLHTAKKLPFRQIVPVLDTPWRTFVGGASALTSMANGATLSTEWPSRNALDTMLSANWSGQITGERTAVFMDWRFRRSPVFKYDVRFLRRDGCVTGYIATRRHLYDGYDCQFIVDAFGRPDVPQRDWAKMTFDQIRREAFRGAEMIMAFGNTSCGPLAAATRWFVGIPERLLPRKTTLFAKWLAEPIFEFQHDSFCLTLADFDMI